MSACVYDGMPAFLVCEWGLAHCFFDVAGLWLFKASSQRVYHYAVRYAKKQSYL